MIFIIKVHYNCKVNEIEFIYYQSCIFITIIMIITDI